MMRFFTIFFPFTDFLYILQIEEYSSRRFLKWLPRFFWRRNIQVRERLVYTERAKITLAVSVGLWGVGALAMWIGLSPLWATVATVAWMLFIPVVVFVANGVLAYGFAFMHARVRTRAAERIAAVRKKCTVVMVAGSFGKTTTKNFIEQLARYQYRIQTPPGNINTPAGIAAWVVHELRDSTTLLIIEADGYSRKEYREICAMVRPDISLITNIGDQHLERFGSRAALADAMSEVVAFAQPDAHVFYTADTKAQLRADVLKMRNEHGIDSTMVPIYHGEKLSGGHLSVSNTTNLHFALAVADVLAIPGDFVADTVQKLTLPDRRQKVGAMYGYEAIDDSYNISWTTALAGVAAAKAAAAKAGKKLLVITAGIMELSPEDQDKNVRLGELLAREADHVVVLGTMFAADVQRGIGDAAKCTMVPSLADFLAKTHTQFSSKEWFLLVQPEMHDLYY